MTVAINGIASIRHATTRVVYEIEAEELDWDQVSGDEEPMGPRLMYEGEIEHPELGRLTWTAWEYPVGILDYLTRDIGPHELIEDFDVAIRFEAEDSEDEALPPPLTEEERQAEIDTMVEWFHQNYEDPANRLPYESAEGGYQWINGGPYDAREEIEGQFPNVAEDLIEAAVEEVESDGISDWASQDFGEFEDQDDDADDLVEGGGFDEDDEDDGSSVEELVGVLADRLASTDRRHSGPIFGRDALGRLDLAGWISGPAPASPLLETLRQAALALAQALAGTNAHTSLLNAAHAYAEAVTTPMPAMEDIYARGVMLENTYRHTLEQIDQGDLPTLPANVGLTSDNTLTLHAAYVMSDDYGRSLVEGAAAYQMPENTTRTFRRAAARLAAEIHQAPALFSPTTQAIVAQAAASAGAGPHPSRSNQVFGWIVGGLITGLGLGMGEIGLSVLVDGFKASVLGADAVTAATATYNSLFNFIACHLSDFKTIFAALGTDPGWFSPMSRLISKLRRDATNAMWG